MITEDQYREMKRLIQEYEDSLDNDYVEDMPFLVGHLNKLFGYNGYKPIEIGTEVFQFQDKYFFYMFPLNDDRQVPCRFYKETLTPCINFL